MNIKLLMCYNMVPWHGSEHVFHTVGIRFFIGLSPQNSTRLPNRYNPITSNQSQNLGRPQSNPICCSVMYSDALTTTRFPFKMWESVRYQSCSPSESISIKTTYLFLILTTTDTMPSTIFNTRATS